MFYRVGRRLKEITTDRHDWKLITLTPDKLVAKRQDIAQVAIRHTSDQKRHLGDRRIP